MRCLFLVHDRVLVYINVIITQEISLRSEGVGRKGDGPASQGAHVPCARHDSVF